jgi:AcrR family transcriptional regulator
MVTATIRIIEEEGLVRVTTNRVAERAGVSVGSLYQYFPNKESLIDAAHARYGTEFHGELHGQLKRIGGLNLEDAIRAIVLGLAKAHAVSPRLHSEFESKAPAEERLQFINFMAGYLAAHSEKIRRPDPRLAAEVIYDVSEALIHGVALRDPARLADDVWLDEVCDVLTRYLI